MLRPAQAARSRRNRERRRRWRGAVENGTSCGGFRRGLLVLDSAQAVNEELHHAVELPLEFRQRELRPQLWVTKLHCRGLDHFRSCFLVGNGKFALLLRIVEELDEYLALVRQHPVG